MTATLETNIPVKALYYQETNVPNIATTILTSHHECLVCSRTLIPAPRIGDRVVILLDHEYFICKQSWINGIGLFDRNYHNKIYPENNKRFWAEPQYDYINNRGRLATQNIDEEIDFFNNTKKVNFVKLDRVDLVYGMNLNVCMLKIDVLYYSNRHIGIGLYHTIERILRGMFARNVNYDNMRNIIYSIDIPVEEFNDFISNLVYVATVNGKNISQGLLKSEYFNKFLDKMFNRKYLIFNSVQHKKIREFL